MHSFKPFDTAAPMARHLWSQAAAQAGRAGKRLERIDNRGLIAAGLAVAGAAVIVGVFAARQASRKGEGQAPDEHHAKDGDKFIERSVTVNKPREELYRYWRDFSNLPGFMEIVESVTPNGDRAHWVVRGPGDKRVEYDTVITEDRPGEVIAWESTGGEVRTESRIEFKDAPGGRGTEVHAKVDYHPPMGRSAASRRWSPRRDPSSRPDATSSASRC
jgi:uncharacterized membrane protein